MRKKIYFRADASTTIGYGHFIRTLALADMLKDNFNCTFFTCHPTSYQVGEMKKVCPLVILQEETHYTEFLSYLQGDEIVVLDNYFFTTDYQKKIKAKGCILICIDDMHDKHYVADVVINHGLTDRSLFDTEPNTQLCLGLRWALLRAPFLNENKISPKKGHWAIAFGGVDIHNLSLLYAKALQLYNNVSHITVIVGDSYKISSEYQYLKKISIAQNLSAEELANLFRSTQNVIVSCSTISIEALCCGCSTYAGYYVDNQKELYYSFLKEKYIIGLGNLLDYNAVNRFNPNIPYHYSNLLFRGIKQKYIDLFSQYEN